ncbi:MAG: hypothetical protein IJ844_05120 [Prevotella sp.]|nr:hypothetical protein [Prevotella sp.]
MKRIYKNPTVTIVELNGGAVCQSLIIGSGATSETTGDGTDLVKEQGDWGDIWGE